jgi:hypothetical protein
MSNSSCGAQGGRRVGATRKRAREAHLHVAAGPLKLALALRGQRGLGGERVDGRLDALCALQPLEALQPVLALHGRSRLLQGQGSAAAGRGRGCVGRANQVERALLEDNGEALILALLLLGRAARAR